MSGGCCYCYEGRRAEVVIVVVVVVVVGRICWGRFDDGKPDEFS